MKAVKYFSAVIGVIFGLAGTALMVGSVLLALNSLDAPVRLSEVPEEAMACSEELMEAVGRGDYETAGNLLYGQPDLGVSREPEDEMGRRVWQAFLDSITYEFTGDCYATDSGISRDAAITTLDISSVAANLQERVKTILDKQVAEAEDMDALYDENNNFREDMVMAALSKAVTDALAEDTTTTRREVTLNLIFREGSWWVVPDQALLQAISGDMAG